MSVFSWLKEKYSQGKRAARDVGFNEHFISSLKEAPRQVFSRQGLGSARGLTEVGKGVARGALNIGTQAIKLAPPVAFAPRSIKPQINRGFNTIQAGYNRLLQPKGNDVQQSIGQGFQIGTEMAPYGAFENAAIKTTSAIPKVGQYLAKSGVGPKIANFALRRGADVLSGQLLTPEQNIPQGKYGRLKMAAGDIVGGTAFDVVGKGGRLVKSAVVKKNTYNNFTNLMNKPTITYEPNPRVNINGKPQMVPVDKTQKITMTPHEFESEWIRKGQGITPYDYKRHAGNVDLSLDDKGNLVSWKTDNPDFEIHIASQGVQPGFSTKNVNLSNRPDQALSTTPKPTQADEAQLKGLGYSQEQINKMKPQEAGTIISEARPPQKGVQLEQPANQTNYDLGTSYQGKKSVTQKTPQAEPKLSNPQVSGQSFDPNIAQTEPQVNVANLNITKKAKKKITETVESIKPELEQVKGRTLSHDEVLEAAKVSKVLNKELDRQKTLEATAAITRLRQEVSAQAEGKGVSKDFIENLKVLKSYSADAGRTLEAFRIKADPESPEAIKETIVKELLNLNKSADEIIEASKNVDFDNPKQVTEFYRSFIKPKIGELVDEYRYINLLSSPQTHIVNAFSNMLQVGGLSPATKLYSGAIDMVHSALTGAERQHYVREVPAYAKGVINSIGTALREAGEVLRGNKYVERPDVARIPTGKFGVLQNIPRMLEAGDILFRTMAKAGEIETLAYKSSRQGKKLAPAVIDKLAGEKAAYSIFRKPPDPSNKTGQGYLLSGIDNMTNVAYQLRKVPGLKWFVPFVQTPMNILKQGIEYSPLGVGTLPGAVNKTEQIAKAMIGSTVFAGAGLLAMRGDSTWAAPTGAKEKAEFYASGRKPYSIKIGNKWYSYSKLGPLAYPIAMAAATNWYFNQDPKATSEDTIDKMTKMLGGIAGFFADQSYLSGIGDFLDVARGEQYAIKNLEANIIRQMVPLSSLQNWVARLIDPVFREGKSVTDKVKTGIPLLSKTVAPYEDPLGNPSVRKLNTLNLLSPIGVSPEDRQFENIYQKTQLEKRSDAEAKAMEGQKSGTKTLSNGRVAVVIDDEIKKFDTQEEAQKALNKDTFKKSGKKSGFIGDTYFYRKSNGDIGDYTRTEYDNKMRTQKLELAYERNDYKTWTTIANEQLKGLEAEYKSLAEDDPARYEIENKYVDLLQKMQKYAGYGGKFKKGKKAKKISLNLSLPTRATRTSITSKLRKPTAPKISLISQKSTGGNYGGSKGTRPRSLRIKRQF